MRLKDYLCLNDLNINEFAKSIKYEPTYLSAIMLYKKRAGRKLIEIVVDATQGQVTKQDMRELNLKVSEYLQKVIAEKQAKEQACTEIN